MVDLGQIGSFMGSGAVGGGILFVLGRILKVGWYSRGFRDDLTMLKKDSHPAPCIKINEIASAQLVTSATLAALTSSQAALTSSQAALTSSQAVLTTAIARVETNVEWLKLEWLKKNGGKE